MARVQVFEPAHVAAIDTARRWVPQSRPARVFAGALAAVMAVVLSAGSLWLVTRVDAVVFFSHLLYDRARTTALEWIGGGIVAAFGQPALDALRGSGVLGVAVGLSLLLASVVVAVLGLRALAVVSRRRRV
jgi:hypothetical protein